MNLIMFAILMTLFLGTMLVLISSHWLMIWIGFEMNMLAMVPIFFFFFLIIIFYW